MYLEYKFGVPSTKHDIFFPNSTQGNHLRTNGRTSDTRRVLAKSPLVLLLLLAQINTLHILAGNSDSEKFLWKSRCHVDTIYNKTWSSGRKKIYTNECRKRKLGRLRNRLRVHRRWCSHEGLADWVEESLKAFILCISEREGLFRVHFLCEFQLAMSKEGG